MRATNRSTRRDARRSTIGIALLFALGLAVTAGAQGLRLSTENDLFTDNPTQDDLYSYSVGFEVERGGLFYSLRENAFTDRAAGVRFDETFLAVGWSAPSVRGWNLFVAGGVAHVGHGLFGEAAQNAVHRAIGADELFLRYRESSFHPRLELRAERFSQYGARWQGGPRLELDSVPGLRHHAALGAQARFRSDAAAIELHLFAGARWSEAAIAPLEPHLREVAAAARLGVVYDDRFFLAWSYNEYGDEREHLSIGYLVPLGRGARREDR